MKKLTSLAIIAACGVAFGGAAVNPYTLAGRLMDSQHAAFDAKRVATISVKNLAGALLSKRTTTYRADSSRNYAISIPVSTDPADGYAVQNEIVDISVVDDLGKTWTGVVVSSAVGAPGAVREVDIVLGEDSDGDGIDDTLCRQLEAMWEQSEYWDEDETFDPKKDYDGDGLSTISEALSGTDPFDPESALRIISFKVGRDGEKTILEFDTVGGHAYEVEGAATLKNPTWETAEFSLDGSEASVNVIAEPSDATVTPRKVYLMPSSGDKLFFRVKAK